ncbi:unnamed protein product [Tilletia controversa]|nr:unnamed protein product [Tilletia controversa]
MPPQGDETEQQVEHNGIPVLRSGDLGIDFTAVMDKTVYGDVDEVLRRFENDGSDKAPVNKRPNITPAGSNTMRSSSPSPNKGSDPPSGFSSEARSSAGRPAKTKPLHLRPSVAAKSKSSSHLRFSEKRGPQKRAPWSSINDKGARFAHMATSAVSSMTRSNEVNLEAQIASMDEKRAILYKVGSFPASHLVKEDFVSLREGGWISGVVLQMYSQHIFEEVQSRSRATSAIGSRKILVLSPSLYVDRCSERGMRIRIDSWFQGESVFRYDKLVVPINFGNQHWATTLISPSKCQVLLIDSIPVDDRAQRVLEFFATLLSGLAERDLQHGKEGTSVPSQALKADCWKIEASSSSDQTYPRQDDGHSCGLITARVIEAALRGRRPSWKNCLLKKQVMSSSEASNTRALLFSVVSSHMLP